jgi:hypothetical protein
LTLPFASLKARKKAFFLAQSPCKNPSNSCFKKTGASPFFNGTLVIKKSHKKYLFDFSASYIAPKAT